MMVMTMTILPVYPGGQRQVYVLTPSTHVAPLTQVWPRQSSDSVTQLVDSSSQPTRSYKLASVAFKMFIFNVIVTILRQFENHCGKLLKSVNTWLKLEEEEDDDDGDDDEKRREGGWERGVGGIEGKEKGERWKGEKMRSRRRRRNRTLLFVNLFSLLYRQWHWHRWTSHLWSRHSHRRRRRTKKRKKNNENKNTKMNKNINKNKKKRKNKNNKNKNNKNKKFI